MNLRGNILPLINLRKRLGFDYKEFDTNTRVIVIHSNGLMTGIIVDRLDEVINVTEDDIEPPPGESASQEKELLKGIAKTDGGKSLVMILDENKILPDKNDYGGGIELKTPSQTVTQEKTKLLEPEKLIITFKLENEEFAMDIMEVQEILRIRSITDVPKSPEILLGIMKLRENIIPLIDIKIVLGLSCNASEILFTEDVGSEDSYDENDTRRIVVLNINGFQAAILVDAVFEVVRISEKLIEQFPHSGNDTEKYKYVQGVCTLDKGNRLLTLISLINTLSKDKLELLQGAIGGEDSAINILKKSEVSEENVELVCFNVGGEEYGINIMDVKEIIRFNSLTLVPNAPFYVAGIVNLRGNVLPVIDLRKRFDKKTIEWNEENRILVVEMGEFLTGLIVDTVNDVITISENDIEYSESVMKTDDRDKLIKGVCKIDNGKTIIILLDVNAVLKEEELQLLKENME